MVVHGPYPVGEPRVARQAATALDDGFQVEVVATQRAGEPAQEIVDCVLVTRLPVRHVRGARVGRMLLEYLLFAAIAAGVVGARAASRPYDVVQVHNPPDFLIVAAMIPRLLGSRVILDIHDPSPEMFAMRFPGGVGTVGSLVLRRLERLATGFADAVLTVHEPYLRELLARGTPSEKVAVVMNGVDERLLPPPKPPTAGPLRVVYHGTVTPPYGVHLLVEAAAQGVEQGLDLHVEIIGEGDSVPSLMRRVVALGLSDRVTIEGRYMPHKAVLQRVNGASVGVVPNLPTPLNRFALSSKLFEYVALGVPVISAGLPTIREYFDDSEVLFFEPGDASSLAAALVQTAADPSGAAGRADKAQLRNAAYAWQINGSRYRSLLATLSARARNDVVTRRLKQGRP
jgi:glycosyltransferase involved in cell wall biosynthesis